MHLLSKQINPDECPIIYDRPFTEESLAEDFEICGGKWHVENGWLIGENRENCAAMVISRNQYNENADRLALNAVNMATAKAEEVFSFKFSVNISKEALEDYGGVEGFLKCIKDNTSVTDIKLV